ncbi:unnamed protein product [Clavelina lepadiformis]|uniref:Uncharacterized protein n=1 Tax=Clavelina lepadiformis TaxID=159417 RepID=A0ABP0GI75_CLALP
MAEWSKAPDSSRGLVALYGSRVFWSPNGGWIVFQNVKMLKVIMSLSLWRNGLTRWTSNLEVPGSSPGRGVRMAEWSKAPDSSRGLVALYGSRVFWSPNGGVGSNPTSDSSFGKFYFTYMLTLCRIALKRIVKSNIEKLMS